MINHPTAQSARLKAQVSDFWGRSVLAAQVFYEASLDLSLIAKLLYANNKNMILGAHAKRFDG
ncbi:hypothetical protein EH31_09070 [Erythrobacter longus]|uniref:Uncharacterized protein n=1 Tax=Erythrobacter longus TaxID=1044 RepID=A0A074MBW1_ERYLO|nr:hypothetical protein EH31_09070 [Erythrobacter longus]